ncbi:dual specificity mitogen-activated protein kinase kinase 7-like isoform X2 [Harmonia axyridis]|uniref:dual specificity mitogen-activated protein kinase kinase 7-like isoform X2 n=1 Tax=Harmonia axyridis TaxID=115357 RepID=UPI001E277048|nr:dual specificity mitogen-activated protein kinase kinase 7-like isoform X2 [Harmonia axyridis]
MSSQDKIDEMLNRIRQPNGLPTNGIRASPGGTSPNRRNLSLPMEVGEPRRVTPRPNALKFTINRQQNIETETKLKEIMKISGKLKINNVEYNTDIKDLELIEELGHGTCGHVYKMKHTGSNEVIAVKQMRRSGNSEENKRIIMDIEVVLKSHDCKFIVQCLGCFITESEVWICMELMATCFDKLLKKLKKPIPERILGKVTVATVEALSYLKDKHGVMHRDVKPSNILLDEKGNVKLCDFGISGRLVDSMAKTRSAGCAAYMAPERIEPNPENPDYDVRADVWSLGITLVELATGVFPYQDCKTDFEVLAKVINQDPPSLPKNKGFSSDFQDFVSCCLRKQHQSRPKYRELKKHAFIKKYETEEVNVGKWFMEAVDEADRTANRQSITPSAFRRFFTSQQPQVAAKASTNPFAPLAPNGTTNPYRLLSQKPNSSEVVRSVDLRTTHSSRLGAFQSLNGHRGQSPQPLEDRKGLMNGVCEMNCFGGNKRDSPAPLPQSSLLRDDVIKFGSPVMPRRQVDSPLSSPYPHKRGVSESRWRTPNTSPLPLRANNEPSDGECCCSNTSPIVFQRFIHQQKQQQLAKEAEEEAKYNPGRKRFTSYIKLQLNGDKNGRSSPRHQSPEPPPRLSRLNGDSPLPMRKNILDSNGSLASPSLSRSCMRNAEE